MSEREFLELLNLYLDREITPADADRLEREIRADASRHRTYLQYCRMQQAVRLLGTAGDIGSEARTAAVPASRKVVPSDRWGSPWVWTGAVAAAALIVLVLGVRRPDPGKPAFENRPGNQCRAQGPRGSVQLDAPVPTGLPGGQNRLAAALTCPRCATACAPGGAKPSEWRRSHGNGGLQVCEVRRGSAGQRLTHQGLRRRIGSEFPGRAGDGLLRLL